MNMVKANYNSGSSPDTASTDDKEKQMTPTSKTQDWLRRPTAENQGKSPLSSPHYSEEAKPTAEDRVSGYPEPPGGKRFSPSLASPKNEYYSGSQLDGIGDPVEKQAPVKRKKFPLGASENERGSKHVIVERF
ncbi:hypothetical protein OESDEN_15490 [Oesophagostomum dentatum]|uniref:Uncharacterized protein n=1 Tax=Oesophagostomum dentatum TaxID=61180 RepID=A0A0B1SLM8_OESDE|nr:hypothetical protein OESDEN_15490 [Oesophagostomum dentatum]